MERHPYPIVVVQFVNRFDGRDGAAIRAGLVMEHALQAALRRELLSALSDPFVIGFRR